jgi:hypothetical protein
MSRKNYLIQRYLKSKITQEERNELLDLVMKDINGLMDFADRVRKLRRSIECLPKKH